MGKPRVATVNLITWSRECGWWRMTHKVKATTALDDIAQMLAAQRLWGNEIVRVCVVAGARSRRLDWISGPDVWRWGPLRLELPRT